MRVRSEYRRTGYKISDALHRDTRHGRKIFYIDTEKLGTENMQLIERAAKEATPKGYEFFRCEAL